MDDMSSPDQQAMDRRILTLMFADLAGSTALAEQLGLDAFDAHLQAFHRRCARIIEKHGGQVLQHYGDGILACFGLQHDGEDAALAGVAAALDLVDAGPEQSIRAGVHSGSVLCRGEPNHRQPQITGLDVNLTARLQALAEPGGVIVSQATLDFVQRLVRPVLRSQQTVAVKGLSQPVRLAEVTQLLPLARFAAPSRLLGREQILAELARPENQLVIAPPGIGKTSLVQRLGDERTVRIHARGNLQRTPLLPFADWLTERLAGQSLSTAFMGRNLSSDDLGALADVLGQAAPDWLAPAQRKANRIGALVRLIQQELTGGQGLLIFEDLHSADDDSIQVLIGLAGQMPQGGRIVATTRPDDRVEQWAAQLGQKPIVLPPLPETEARSLLQDTALSADQIRAILDRAEGNPLFLLSLKAAVEGGQSGLPQTIEATLQSLIQAQGMGKDALLKAAVIGRYFVREQLDWLGADPAVLTTAEKAGLVVAEGEGWRFAHGLLRDAAYQMLPRARRQSLHQAFALALEARDPEAARRFPEVLADHYLAAEDVANAAKACLAAGLSFLQRADFDLAIHYLEQATAMQGSHRLTAMTYLAAALQQKLGFAHPQVGRAYALLETEAQAPDSGGLERMVALYGLFAQRMIGGDVQGCHELILNMRALADPADSTQQILLLVNESAFGLYSGRFGLAEQANAALRKLYDPDQHKGLFLRVGADPLGSILSAEVHIYAQRGNLEAARLALKQGLQHLDSLGAALQIPWLQIFGSLALFFGGSRDEARDLLKQGLELADRQGAGFWQLIGRIWEAVFQLYTAPEQADLDRLEMLLGHANAIGAGLQGPLCQAVMAKAALALGNPHLADQASEMACDLTGQRGEGLWAALIWNVRAAVLHSQGREEASLRARQLSAAYARLSGATIWANGH